MHYETSPDPEVTLRVPFQAAPVDRTPAGAAAFGSEAGVDASFDWGGLISQVASAAIPALAAAL